MGGSGTDAGDVVRQLKRERNILAADNKVLEEKCKRVTTQAEHIQRELDFARSKLRADAERRSRVDLTGEWWRHLRFTH